MYPREEVLEGVPVVGWSEHGGIWYPKYGVELYGCGCDGGPDHVVHVAGEEVRGEARFWLFCETCESEL